MTTVESRPKKVRAGLYDYRGRCIIRTDWGGEGPRGGKRYVWELGYFDDSGVPTIDGGQYRTLSAALAAVDAELQEPRQTAT